MTNSKDAKSKRSTISRRALDPVPAINDQTVDETRTDAHRLMGLPDGWTQTDLGTLLHQTENASPRDSGHEEFYYVDIQAVDNKLNQIKEPKRLSVGKAPSRARRIVQTGDIITSLVRPYLKNTAMVPAELNAQWASTAFCVCRTRNSISSRFLFYLFISDQFVHSIPTYGDSPPAGHPDDLLAMKVLLPPAPEQSRIADRIEELFTDLDAGVAALQRVQKKLKRYRAALLHAAVTGRLTADWRAKHGDDGETGSQLLERILVARREVWEERTLAEYEAKGRKPPKDWRLRYKDPGEPRLAGLPALPHSWLWSNFDQCTSIQGGLQKSPKRNPVEFHFPYLRVANVKRGQLDLTDVHRFELSKFELDRLRLVSGDILIVEGNGSVSEIGRSAVWRDEIKDCVHQNHIIRCRAFEGFDSEFADSAINSPIGQLRMRSVSSSSSGLHTLSVQKIRDIPLPLPPLAEQLEIVERIQTTETQIEAMEAEVERGLRRSGRLRQAILKAAFEGKLVPQNPDDEPASELLARIQAEADAEVAAAPKRTPRKRKTTKKKTSKKETA